MDKNKILKQEVHQLDNMTIDELKKKFKNLYGFTSKDITTLTIKKRIIYKLQEIKFGGISTDDIEYLKHIAKNDPLANLINKSNQKSIIKGTRLSREWQGIKHEVLSNGNGNFIYKNKSYKSLSAIAREITGTRWNGKVFFGVKK